MKLIGAALAFLAMASPLVPLHAADLVPSSPPVMCSGPIVETERAAQIPARLLGVLALVESGRRIPAGVPGAGRVAPWPWTINVNGTGFFFDSKDEAITAVQALQAQGVQSIDVGCMQVNLFHHARAFASLDAAFDPATNVAYAARFLRGLYAQTGTWPRAAAAYHSQTPELGADYLRRVMALWPEGQRFDPFPLAAEVPHLYTPELASQITADRAGLQQVLARMRLPAPTDMTARRAGLLPLPHRFPPGRISVQASTRLPQRPGDTDLPAPNMSALAAFRPTAMAATRPTTLGGIHGGTPGGNPGRPGLHASDRFRAASLALRGDTTGALQ